MAKLDDGEYMAFGLSGDPRRTKMIGGKFMLNCHVIRGSGTGGTSGHIRRTQLLFATGIERGIHDRQVLKYQPSVTSRVIFHHLIPLMIIEY